MVPRTTAVIFADNHGIVYVECLTTRDLPSDIPLLTDACLLVASFVLEPWITIVVPC